MFWSVLVVNVTKAFTGLDRESVRPLQLHTGLPVGNPILGHVILGHFLFKITCLQLYNSFASRYEVKTGGLNPYPIQ